MLVDRPSERFLGRGRVVATKHNLCNTYIPSRRSKIMSNALFSSTLFPTQPPSLTAPAGGGGQGRGKGRAGLGKGGAKRLRKVIRESIQGITNPTIRRLARRGGVKRIAKPVYETVRGVLKNFLENILKDAMTYTDHARRKTVTSLDIVHALKRNGRTLYGFGQ